MSFVDREILKHCRRRFITGELGQVEKEPRIAVDGQATMNQPVHPFGVIFHQFAYADEPDDIVMFG